MAKPNPSAQWSEEAAAAVPAKVLRWALDENGYWSAGPTGETLAEDAEGRVVAASDPEAVAPLRTVLVNDETLVIY